MLYQFKTINYPLNSINFSIFLENKNDHTTL